MKLVNRGLLAMIFIASSHLQAASELDLTESWQKTPYGLYLFAKEAYEMKRANPNEVILLDVRNQAEVHYTGIADSVDAVIPYRFDSTIWKMKNASPYGTYKKVRNPDFIIAVKRMLELKGKDNSTPIIVMCTTGTRAPFAAKLLHKNGFEKVYTVLDGFEGNRAKDGAHKGKRVVNGWKNEDLPWNYDLLPEKMYFNFKPDK